MANRIFLCCWDTYVPVVLKGLKQTIAIDTLVERYSYIIEYNKVLKELPVSKNVRKQKLFLQF